jgi:hypothetical protein
MVHTAVVLPRDLLERLRMDADRGEQGLSTEIRQRLLIYERERLQERDRQTTDLLQHIRLLADNLAGDLGEKWYRHPYALEAFKAGVAAFLAQYQLEGDASVPPDTRVVGEAGDPPDVVGRTHARLILKRVQRDVPPAVEPMERRPSTEVIRIERQAPTATRLDETLPRARDATRTRNE